ncbi:ATP-binding protein (contains P-loop) [Granulibacter bethesdensis]|uniref:ATP-binding protein (Contains P-loop) n=1 Tax=Granulibacter bethesdensis TaxID=364410 RepID=A0AAC9KBC7_9PROT|nr:RNase adapter RapZ [Granulibacter bethesdensis]APH53632.1 ATP-binding protein (contains P-loop) [Granulibacter bethesdensis]APH61210.1 ATP-binding protein (contains P-loop) [Granulibacter bethesdensis]
MSTDQHRRVVVITGLSGAGKSTILRALEDAGYETVDNPPLPLVHDLVTRGEGPLAFAVDARSRGFTADGLALAMERMKQLPGVRADLVFVRADTAALLSRYTETRHRHPLASGVGVQDGIRAEEALTASLVDVADLVVDTTDLPVTRLRAMIAERYGPEETGQGMVVSLISFAYPKGLPREADLVLDARFLRNPHYDPTLKPRTGQDRDVAAYIEADPDYATFHDRIDALLRLLLPRFVQEGKKYATVAIGCTGGRHRSVHLVERLAGELRAQGWSVLRTHRELGISDDAPQAEAAGAGSVEINGRPEEHGSAQAPDALSRTTS